MKYQDEQNFGFCVKDLDLLVQYQNSFCEKVCGRQIGKKCSQGCILKYKHHTQLPVSNLGLQFLTNLKFSSCTRHLDGIVINDGKNVTTYLFDTSFAQEGKLQYLKGFSLTASELRICKMVLEGCSNAEIAEALFISDATLHTHLNNIYKKIPANFALR